LIALNTLKRSDILNSSGPIAIQLEISQADLGSSLAEDLLLRVQPLNHIFGPEEKFNLGRLKSGRVNVRKRGKLARLEN
jgi:hypothetical protein